MQPVQPSHGTPNVQRNLGSTQAVSAGYTLAKGFDNDRAIQAKTAEMGARHGSSGVEK